MSGQRASLPGELHRHRRRHLRDVRRSAGGAGLHSVTSQDAAGLEVRSAVTSASNGAVCT